ncbi:DUF1285 domain-containing protein [Chelatococcus sp. GCM10030263]|uniref:DUF1285 domain-containing protein n=1 Tax=Chelatococcus sp. GCM10030263 TaxID=3273387 RepID=UPI003613E87F
MQDATGQGPLLQGLDGLGGGRKTPPVERWNPPYCGAIDMRIAVDGTWFYQGSPIRRPALVKLFSSVLRKDPDRYVLVTPVECVGITVEDVPFLVVEMASDAAGVIHVRTNVDDVAAIGPDHPLRFDVAADGGLKPYVKIRGDLWARMTRALVHDLVAQAEEREVAGVATFGVASGTSFFPIAPVVEIQGLDDG